MNTFPPYEIAVYNRVAQRMVGSYFSNQVPQRGDQVSFYGHRIPGDPFELWGRWSVAEVVWCVASQGSMNALELARTHGTRGEAACTRVEIHCWPAEGPFFHDTPKWAKTATEPGYHDEDDASADGTTATEVAKSNQRVTKAYAEELDKALQLLAEYVDDEPCHIDHNGYCQEHSLSSTRHGGCRNVRAKQLLADNSAGETKTSNEEDHDA